MKINEVEKLTGLTSKAIRLYEEKGLISVKRSENQYRDYDESCVNILREIKLLRDVGIGLSEIRLFLCGILSKKELIGKRISEIEAENKTADKQYADCLSLLKSDTVSDHETAGNVTSDENVAIGIDIGTTTISTVVISLDKKTIEESYTVLSGSNIPSEDRFKEQDTDIIINKVLKTAEFLKSRYSNIKSIGFTGQMHGIVYTDADGKAASPLYNWQDGRADRKCGNVTYCEKIKELTGYTVSSGFGLATHYYNLKNGLVPENAVSFCTIMDYAVMVLTGRKAPLIHVSNAASLGLFDIEKCEFDKAAIQKLGIDTRILPAASARDEIAGYYCGIPVCVAIGDNQASIFGTLADEKKSVLLNYGTGSQISAVTDTFRRTDGGFELRPYFGGKYLLNYSALCGGKAYAITERFFSSFADELNLQRRPLYDIMNKLALDAISETDRLKASTLFCGTRQNPSLRGSIENIGEHNFTPASLILGILQGMVDELADKYSEMELSGITHTVASGNSVRKNPALQRLISDSFGVGLFMTETEEEAAFGAALYSLAASGLETEKNVKSFIKLKKYEEEEK